MLTTEANIFKQVINAGCYYENKEIQVSMCHTQQVFEFLW